MSEQVIHDVEHHEVGLSIWPFVVGISAVTVMFGFMSAFQWKLSFPKKINLLDVIDAIEGPVAMNRCAVNRKICSLSSNCAVHPIWVELRKDVEKKLRKTDFAKLIELQKR